jgi:hypothetical protein
MTSRVRPAWVAYVLILVVMTVLPGSYAAFSGTTSSAASFSSSASFPTYPQGTVNYGSRFYHRQDEAASAQLTSTAVDSSGGNLPGTYAAPTDGPALWYPFDENTGTTAADVSGGANPGALLNGATWGGGQIGTSAAGFDGVDDYVRSARPAVDTSSSFTVAAWVYLSDQTVTHAIVSQDGSARSGFSLRYDKTLDRWSFSLPASDTAAAASVSVNSPTSPSSGTWTHLTAVYDDADDELRLYLNGQLSTSAVRTVDWSAGGPVIVGADLNSSDARADYFAGQIDDLRVYPEALTGPQVSEVFAMPGTAWTFTNASTTQPDASSNGNTGTINGTPSYAGGTVVMDGDDYVTGQRSGVHTDRGFTVAAWVTPNSTTGTQTIASQSNTTADTANAFSLGLVSGKWQFATATSSTATGSGKAISTTSVTAGTPVFVVGVFSDNNMDRIYINGKKEDQQSVGTPYDATGPLTVGRQAAGATNYFAGRVDDVRVFNHMLTGEDVFDLYSMPTARYDFDESYTGPVAVDGSGNARDAVAETGSPTWRSAGHRGGALSLSGTADLTGPAAVVATNTSYAVAAWVYLPAGGTDRTAVSEDGATNSAFRLGYVAAGGKWAFTQRAADATGTAVSAVSSAAAIIGKWTHLVGVYDGPNSRITLYVDGVAAATVTTTGDFAATGPLVIGADLLAGTRGDRWSGYLDQVATFGKAFSASDVTNLHSQDPTLHWTFSEGAGTTIGDQSGNNNVGTAQNGPTWTTGVNGGSALKFDGLDDQVVSTSNPVDTTTGFTVAAWVYLTDNTTDQVVLSLNGANAPRFSLIFQASNKSWQFVVNGTDSATSPHPSQANGGANSAPLNTWTHLVATYDDTINKLRVYVNGAFTNNAAYTGALWNPSNPLVLGYSLDTSVSRFRGRIGDVLASQSVSVNYNAPALYTGSAIEPAAWQPHLPGMSAGLFGALQGSQQGETGSTAMAYNGTAAGYNNTPLTNPGPCTIELWFRVSGTRGGALAGFTTSATSASTGADRVLYIDNGGHLVFGVSPGGVNTTIATTGTYNDAAWHHAAASVGTAGTKLYVDGVLANVNTGVTTALNTTGYLRWGGVSLSGWAARPAGDYLIGTLDEVAFYPTQLTDNQIARHYASNH